MIYTAYDYLTKYGDTIGEIINLAELDGYSFDFIEKTLYKSSMIKEFEESNITQIAFNSSILIYRKLFPNSEATTKDIHLFSSYYWIGEMYIKIFFKYKVNFETIFAYLPIQKMHELYEVYHEMDVTQFYRYFESLKEKNTFEIFLKEKELTLKALSNKTGISVSTLKALKEGKRDFVNLKSSYLEKISHYLGVEMQTLLGEITLEIK
jgi:DNA-binding Xre family transcriptional regulator